MSKVKTSLSNFPSSLTTSVVARGPDGKSATISSSIFYLLLRSCQFKPSFANTTSNIQARKQDEGVVNSATGPGRLHDDNISLKLKQGVKLAYKYYNGLVCVAARLPYAYYITDYNSHTPTPRL